MKMFPIQAAKNDIYNACALLGKASVLISAIQTVSVALNYFFQAAEPTCADILKTVEGKEYIGYHAWDCFDLQQHAVGMGTPEECMAALANYHPSQASTLDVVAAMGGAETFCKLPSIQLEKRLASDKPIPDSILATILKHGPVRGTDQTPGHLFAGMKTSVTKTTTHPLLTEEEIEKNGLNSYNKPQAEIFFHAFGETKRAWVTASCQLGQWRCSPEILEDSTIEDLGRLVKGETVCNEEITPGISTKTCRVMI